MLGSRLFVLVMLCFSAPFFSLLGSDADDSTILERWEHCQQTAVRFLECFTREIELRTVASRKKLCLLFQENYYSYCAVDIFIDQYVRSPTHNFLLVQYLKQLKLFLHTLISMCVSLCDYPEIRNIIALAPMAAASFQFSSHCLPAE